MKDAINLKEKISEFKAFYAKLKSFFELLHPIVLTLILMLMISVPITIVSTSLNKDLNREVRKDIIDELKSKKMADVALDLIVATPLKEELQYRLPIMILSYFKTILTLENPILWIIFIM